MARIERVSVSSDGSQANGGSGGTSAISADGRYVAFWSNASNLVAGDTNGTFDVFLRDLQTGTTRLVSLADDESLGNDVSGGPALSGDGRFVAFTSDANNLVPDDTNFPPDIFIRDLKAGTTTRVSVGDDESQPNDQSFDAAISADGRYVAFYSYASNLVTGDTNSSDVFVRDLQAGTTIRVSVGDDEAEAQGESRGRPALSADGRYVAFGSDAANLIAGDTNGSEDVFVRDLQAGTTTRVSIGDDESQANGHSFGPAFSADGRYVIFNSSATNLVAGDTNGAQDVFVRDLQAGRTTRVSVGDDESQPNGRSFGSAFSADGHYVAFTSSASNLVPGDTNAAEDAFLRDLQAGTTIRLTDAGDYRLLGLSISGDGQRVSFVSGSPNLVDNDTNGEWDVFVWIADREAAPVVRSGGDSDDKLVGTSGDDILDGKDGADRLYGEAGDDVLRGGSGPDRLAGQDGADDLRGGDGDDKLIGGSGNDRLAGNDGADRLYGEDGDDVAEGGAGADRIEGQDGNDILEGREGADRLLGGAGDDRLNGGDGQDRLFGEEGDDRLAGDAGSDRLSGGTGADELDGGDGDDRLYGGRGGDTLIASQGTDKLFGDEGRDVAVFGGMRADFDIAVFDGYTRLTDRNSADGDLGATYLIGVERAGFSDGFVDFPDPGAEPDSELYFSASHADHGRGVWRYADGEPTMLGGGALSGGTQFVEYQGKVYFEAFTPTGLQLFVYDGTSASPVPHDQGTSFRLSASPYDGGNPLVEYDGKLYFIASADNGPTRLFSYDGTGIYLVSASVGNPTDLTLFDGRLYFSGMLGEFGSGYGHELGSYDGDRVRVAADLQKTIVDLDEENEVSYWFSDSRPRGLTVADGKLYFGAIFDTEHQSGSENLYVHDGVSTTEIGSRPGGSWKVEFGVAHEDKVYIPDGDGLLIVDDNGVTRAANPHGAAGIDEVYVHDGSAYFRAYTGETGDELYYLDGTTIELADDIVDGSAGSYPQGFASYLGYLYIVASGNLYAFDGWETDQIATGIAARELHVAAGELVFTAASDEAGRELWAYDGTEFRQFDINPGLPGSEPAQLTPVPTDDLLL